jgi:hypothetical protein
MYFRERHFAANQDMYFEPTGLGLADSFTRMDTGQVEP